MFAKRVLASAVALTLISAGSAAAAPIGLVLHSAPDIFSGGIDIDYNAATDQFSALGFSLSFDDDGVGPSHNITGPQGFTLNATIDGAGNATGGSLAITGSVLGFGPSLLTGSLTNFGWVDGTSELFEFEFTVTGGDLAIPAYYGGAGSTFGLILTTPGSNFTGLWTVDFNNDGGIVNAGADTAPIVPEPASIGLAGLAFVMLLRRSRR